MQPIGRWLWIVGVLVVVAFAFTRLPSGYGVDLAQIGQGEPAAVLVHNDEFVESQLLMNALDTVRREFESDLLLLIADQNRAEGREFAAAHGLRPVTLALFDGDGRRVAVYTERGDAEDLRRFLAAHVPER